MKFGNYNLTSAQTDEGKSKSLLLFRFKKVKTTANQIVGKVHHTIGTFRRMRSESPLSFRAALFDKTKYIESEDQFKFDPEDFPSTNFSKDSFVSPFTGGNDIKQVVENQRLIGPGRPRSSVENFYSSLRNLNEVRTVSIGRKYSRNELLAATNARRPPPLPLQENNNKSVGRSATIVAETLTLTADQSSNNKKPSKENMMEYLNAKHIDESLEYEVLKEYFDTYSYSDICMDKDFKNYLTRKNYNDILDMMGPENGTLLSRGSLARSKGSLDRRCRQAKPFNGSALNGPPCSHMNNIAIVHQHRNSHNHSIEDTRRRRRRSESSVHYHPQRCTSQSPRRRNGNDEDEHGEEEAYAENHRVSKTSAGRGSGTTRNPRPHLHEFHGEMKENLLTLRKYATIESIYNQNNSTNTTDPYSLVDDHPWPPGGHCQHMPAVGVGRTTSTTTATTPSSEVVPPLPPIKPVSLANAHLKKDDKLKQTKLVKTLQHNYSKSKSTPSLKYFSDINDHLDMIDIRNEEAPSRIENFSKIGSNHNTLARMRNRYQPQSPPPNNINEHYSTFPTHKLKNKNFTNSLKRIKNVFNNNNNSNANHQMQHHHHHQHSRSSATTSLEELRARTGKEKNMFKFHDKNCFYAKSYCEIIQLCKQFFSETDLTTTKVSKNHPEDWDESDDDVEAEAEYGEEYFPTQQHPMKSFTLPRCKSLPNISQVHDGKPKKFCSYGYKKIILGYVKSKGYTKVNNYVDSKFGKIIDRALNENHIISRGRGGGNFTLPRVNRDKDLMRNPRNDSIRRFLYEDAFKTFDYVKSDPTRRYMCSSCGQWTEPTSTALYERSDSEKFLAAAAITATAVVEKPTPTRKYATVRYKKNTQQFNSLSWRNRTDKKLNKLDRVCIAIK